MATLSLAGCAVDWAHPHFSGALKEFVEDRGEGGFIANPELAGALNKIKGGWPVLLGVTFRFDWFLGRKLPGEK